MKFNKNLNTIAVTTSIQPPINGCDKEAFERESNAELTCTSGNVNCYNLK